MSGTRTRAAGPKSIEYNELESIIIQYYEMLRRKNKAQVEKFLVNIRKFVLINPCPEEDILPEYDNNENDGDIKDDNDIDIDDISTVGPSTKHFRLTSLVKPLPSIRKVEDTLRGKLWRVLIGVSLVDATDYQKYINKKESPKFYIKIRGDTTRTFLTSNTYNSRVSEERLVRVLNSYVHKTNKPYVQGMDAIAAGLLYVMPEVNAFYTFNTLVSNHFPYYYHSSNNIKESLVGAFAGSILAHDILKIYDSELFNHISHLKPYHYIFPVIQSFNAVCRPFEEMIRLWDFLFAFGVHLNVVTAVAQLVHHKKIILSCDKNKLAQTILGQRNWLELNSRQVINIAMDIVIKLQNDHPKVWEMTLKHCSNINVAMDIVKSAENDINDNSNDNNAIISNLNSARALSVTSPQNLDSIDEDNEDGTIDIEDAF